VLPGYVFRDAGEAGAIVWYCEEQQLVYPKLFASLDFFDQIFSRNQAAQTMTNKGNRFVVGIPYFDLAAQALRQIANSRGHPGKRQTQQRRWVFKESGIGQISQSSVGADQFRESGKAAAGPGRAAGTPQTVNE
jgi:hypothetical protein